MKTLYFDIDGTVILADRGEAKPSLAGGQLEVAIRRAGFDQLICVGNFSRLVELVKAVQANYDGLGVLFGICRGAFTDELWFRSVASFVADPVHRFEQVNLSSDWWYVDDLAADYIRAANKEDLLKLQLGQRVFIPDPTGDGQDVLDWLDRTAV